MRQSSREFDVLYTLLFAEKPRLPLRTTIGHTSQDDLRDLEPGLTEADYIQEGEKHSRSNQIEIRQTVGHTGGDSGSHRTDGVKNKFCCLECKNELLIALTRKYGRSMWVSDVGLLRHNLRNPLRTMLRACCEVRRYQIQTTQPFSVMRRHRSGEAAMHSLDKRPTQLQWEASTPAQRCSKLVTISSRPSICTN